MKKTLLSENIKALSSDKISFHMPGHKSGKVFNKPQHQILKDIASIDITEINGADNLFDPESIIKDSMEKAGQFYNTIKTRFLVNGTTAGIISMIMASTKPKEKVIVQRDCHKSVINGLILGDLTPIYIESLYDYEKDISLGIDKTELESLLEKHEDVKAVILTYPSYYGFCSSIEEIVKIVHNYNKVVLVDGAHEAHFNLSDRLPMSALEAGADIVVHSTHKSLPAFTQSSMIHVNSERVDINRLMVMLSMHQSSSPSYVLMSSLDMAMDIVIKDGSVLMEELIRNIEDFICKIRLLNGVTILDRELIDSRNIKDHDITKILLSVDGYSGGALQDILMEHGIHIELYTKKYVLLLATIGNTKDDFESIYNVLKNIDIKNDKSHKEYKKITISPKVMYNPREAFYMDTESIALLECKDRVSGEYIVPYPPGIPLVSPGELITEDILIYIREALKKGINIIGTEDTTLDNINVLIERGN